MDDWNEIWKDVLNPKSNLTKSVRNDLAEHGYELTPQQLVEEHRKIMNKLRNYIKSQGGTPPESDKELFELIMEMIKN